ncbi:uncharacterized protein LOC141668195 isoform X3 [Apium graveolens]|uniref:uncharacterized protein LOC141668195 isoform X3 n=1 Tax=Apium graveolens TaxID=4045 RepID=UPI003D7B949E
MTWKVEYLLPYFTRWLGKVQILVVHSTREEDYFLKAILAHFEAEMIVNDMKEEVYRLHMCLDERNGKFQEAASTAENEGVAFEFRTMDGFVLVAGEIFMMGCFR